MLREIGAPGDIIHVMSNGRDDVRRDAGSVRLGNGAPRARMAHHALRDRDPLVRRAALTDDPTDVMALCAVVMKEWSTGGNRGYRPVVGIEEVGCARHGCRDPIPGNHGASVSRDPPLPTHQRQGNGEHQDGADQHGASEEREDGAEMTRPTNDEDLQHDQDANQARQSHVEDRPRSELALVVPESRHHSDEPQAIHQERRGETDARYIGSAPPACATPHVRMSESAAAAGLRHYRYFFHHSRIWCRRWMRRSGGPLRLRPWLVLAG